MCVLNEGDAASENSLLSGYGRGWALSDVASGSFRGPSVHFVSLSISRIHRSVAQRSSNTPSAKRRSFRNLAVRFTLTRHPPSGRDGSC